MRRQRALVSILLATTILLIKSASGQFPTVFEDPKAAVNPLATATLVTGRSRVPFGRAITYVLPTGACSLDITVAPRSGTVDVVLLPLDMYRQWTTCQHDIGGSRIVCRDIRNCSKSVQLPPGGVLQRQVLLVGRSRIDNGGVSSVAFRVTGEKTMPRFCDGVKTVFSVDCVAPGGPVS